MFDAVNLASLASRYIGVMLNVLERSKIAEQLLETMGHLFGPVRGGLGYSVVVVVAFLAASTGVVGATVVTMGLLSLPTMMRAGYDPRLASGIICASGHAGPDHSPVHGPDFHR
ncbi:MAG: C4 dicarboxylate transporter permease [Rhodospirillaceae bacterium]|nr:MAG: C4 dicarboxylate transporter permease [Rhodospirillaceae bacterium]